MWTLPHSRGSDVVKTTDHPPGGGGGGRMCACCEHPRELDSSYVDGLRTDVPRETLVRWA